MLKRIAEAIDPRDKAPKRRRAIVEIAARDFLSQLPVKTGSKGGTGYDGWKLSNMCDAIFWAMLLLSQRRERFAIRLLGQVHRDTKALRLACPEEKTRPWVHRQGGGTMEPVEPYPQVRYMHARRTLQLHVRTGVRIVEHDVERRGAARASVVGARRWRLSRVRGA